MVKASPYSYIAFAATDEESKIAYMTGIEESDLTDEEKENLQAELQDIRDRYPDGFKVEDNEPLEVVAGIMEQRFIESEESKRDDLDKSMSNEDQVASFNPFSPAAFFCVFCLFQFKYNCYLFRLESDSKI